MITLKTGDLFESGAQTLVNAINCVGVMGRGIALDFRNRFPEMYKDYVLRCRRGEVKLGEPYLYRSAVEPWVLNFPTKGHFRVDSKLADVVAGLEYVEQNYYEWGITSLACPALGCGLGKLSWSIVGPVLYQGLGRLDIPVDLYAPVETPAEQMELPILSSRID